jgi:3-isopropylmalate/(R)-2-methylmalate dehydratase small subunit
MKVAIGGTFDLLHDGHRVLLRKAYELSNLGRVPEVVIGLTSDEMASRNRREKLMHLYAEREENLRQYLGQQPTVGTRPKRAKLRIVKLEDKYGPTLSDDFDFLVVSPETYPTGEEINEIRRRHRMTPIKIIKVDYVPAEDGKPISSTRIRRGEIDEQGRLQKRNVEQGKVLRVFPADTNTDEIISGKYKYKEADIERLAMHAFESIDPHFYEDTSKTKNPIIVASMNFGCGSSREHAPMVIKACGISSIVAESFARIFYRNAINIGLRLIECENIAEKVEKGDELEIGFDTCVIFNKTKKEEYESAPLPEFMQKIVDDGGLIAYLKRRGGFD